jgi:hypothetical protein
MAKIIFVIFLSFTVQGLFAQYLHYTDTRSVNTNTTHAAPAPQIKQESPVKIQKDTIKILVKDTVKLTVRDTIKEKVTVRDTLKLIVHDTVRITVRDTFQIVIHDTVNICPTVVYHKWPDKCPGLSGSIPVINNYVAPEMILKLTEYFEGHLYSISSTRNASNKVQYKLKVCENGQIQFEYADENGNIISKQPAGKK